MKTKRIRFTFLQKYRWYLIGLAWLVGLVLGYVGFTQMLTIHGEQTNWAYIAYLTIQLIFLESGAVKDPPLTLDIARFLLPFLTAQTSLMALAGIFAKQIRQFTLRFSSNHIIVCGDGKLGFFATRALLKSGKRIALITQNENVNEINAIEELGGVVILGKLANPEVAKKVALYRAGYLFSFYDDDNENIENTLHVDRIGEQHKGTLQSIAHLHDPLLSSLFLEQMLKAAWRRSIQHDVINVYEQGARLVLQKFPVHLAENRGTKPSVLIIGFGRFGQHLLKEIARELITATPQSQADVYILDREAEWKLTALRKRYPRLDQICCITAYQMDIFSPEFQDTDTFLQEHCHGVDQVYVCLNDDMQGINTALTIYRQLQERSPQIILRLSESNGIKDLFQYAEQTDKIKIAAIYDEIGTPDVLLNSSVELLGRAFHEHYLQQRKAEGGTGPAVVEWMALSEDKKESNRNLARYLKQHLNMLGYQMIPQQGLMQDAHPFSADEVDFLAQKEHERWVMERRAEGWRYGTVNDAKKKTNPDLQPWDKLTDGEKKLNPRAYARCTCTGREGWTANRIADTESLNGRASGTLKNRCDRASLPAAYSNVGSQGARRI